MTTDLVIEKLTTWAAGRHDVHALILTSTRAIPGAAIDAYSDYDVVIIVDDVRSLATNIGWLDSFGEVLVSYWDPVHSNHETGATWVGSVNHYTSGLKIDFSVWSRQRFTDVTSRPDPHPEFDAGYRVLLDKEGLTAGLSAPTFKAYIPLRPTQDDYERLVADFLIGVLYVAKSLRRRELLPAKFVLDYEMRFNCLLPMLQWRSEIDQDWSLRTGYLGKRLQTQLSPERWKLMLASIVGADLDSNWDALFTMAELFEQTAEEVARSLGYNHLSNRAHLVTEHAHRIQDGLDPEEPRPPDRASHSEPAG